MTEIDERREELMRFHGSDLRALARLKHVNLSYASTPSATSQTRLLWWSSTAQGTASMISRGDE